MKICNGFVLLILLRFGFAMPWDRTDAILSAIQEQSSGDSLHLRLVFQGDPSPAWQVRFDSTLQEMHILLASTSLKEQDLGSPDWVQPELKKDSDGSNMVVLRFPSTHALSYLVHPRQSELRMSFQDLRKTESLWSSPWLWISVVILGIAGTILLLQ